MRKIGIALATVALGVGCTDADKSRLVALGEPATIECFSGGVSIYKARSTGAIAAEDKSDGWYLRDSATKKLVRVSGDCVIRSDD